MRQRDRATTSSARSQEIDAAEPGVHVLTDDRRGGGVEAPRAAGDRPRAAARCTSSSAASAPAWRRSTAARPPALCWVSPDGRDRPGGGGDAPEDLVPVVLAALDRVAKTKEPEHLRRLLHHRLLVAPAAPARARLPGLLAELGHVLGAAAGPRPLPAHRPAYVLLIALPHFGRMRERARDAGRKALAFGVLLVAAWMLFKLVIGVVVHGRVDRGRGRARSSPSIWALRVL